MNQIESSRRESLFGLSQRLPPSNTQAEQALLGALLANNKAYDRVSEFLAPEHFADPLHGRIFQAVTRRIEAGQLADAVTLRAEFEHSGLLDEVGGVAYLGQLLTAMVGIINAGEYGRAIHDAWLRRQLIDIGETVVNNAFGAEPELDGTRQIEAGAPAGQTAYHGRGPMQLSWNFNYKAAGDALNVAAAARYARTLPAGSSIVTVLCDGGDRYRSRLYDDAWLRENDVVPTARDLSFL